LNTRITKNSLALVALIVGLLLLASCTGGVVARGWAGVSMIDDTLIFATMTGKIYSVDKTGTVLGTPVNLVVSASGGLSCIPTCGGSQTRPVAMYASPGVAGDLVYFAGNDGRVHAYQLVDGRLRDQTRWIYPPEGGLGSVIIGGLTVANNKVYLSSADGTVYALTAPEGYKEWSYSIGAKIWSAPAVGTDTVYIGSFDKKVYALDINTGTKKWEYETEGAITAAPLVNDGIVYFGSYDRHMYALDTSGKLVWKFPATDNITNSPQNWFWVTPVIQNGILYAPCLDGKVYVLDAATGGFMDAIDLRYNNNRGAISSSPVIVDNTLVIAVSDLAKKTSRVYAIDTNSKGVKEITGFTTEAINAPLFAADGIVYIHTTSDNFYGLNAQNGALQKFSLTTSK
jgi:outer membrane protein assembly factor BamB